MQIGDIVENNTPFWREGTKAVEVPQQTLPRDVDVLIVGAGYAGLAAGLALARAGRSAAALDAMSVVEGASSLNGGITSGNIRPAYDAIAKRFGEEKALAIEAEGKVAREFLGDFIRREQLDCDYQLTGAFSGAIGSAQYETMARGAERLARRLDVQAWAVPHSEQQQYVGTEFYRGGTVRMDIGGLHPARFHGELLRIALAAGLAVHTHTAVISIEKLKNGFRVHTSRGPIEALKVLVCTNGYTDSATPSLQRRLVPVRSRMIATEELPADLMARLMPKGMMMGERLQLGFYYRPSPDGRRILLGGRDGSYKGNPVGPALRLRDGLIARFPELATARITHSWFGNVAMNRDMLPRIFECDGVLYATGFCGSGTVWAPWLGTRAAHKLLGNKEVGASAFDFEAPAPVPLYRGKPWFIPAVIQGYRLQDFVAMTLARR